MVGDILKIKNYIPPLVSNTFHRPRLTERLDSFLTANEGFARQLTLLSAPAGYGKTTVVRGWLKGKESNTAWLSIDEEDNEPERFWTYLLSALQNLNVQNIDGDLGQGPLEMLSSGSMISDTGSSINQILTPLLNDLFSIENLSYLVLDDYHLINEPEIHKNLAFFIENLPPTLHLIVTTRSDPPWPLHSWRAKGKMAEIRMADLKFTEDETAKYLENISSPRLNEFQLNTLYKKTDGWITGLQLAAFSLSSSQDIDQFIDTFAGSHRHVLLFLSEEVYNRQTEEVKEFLSKTAVLNRFSASLCNAVMDRSDSMDIIDSLEKENLFLISLDEEGTWFRYHPLFSDLLLRNLKLNYPDSVNLLYEKAGKWFLEAGEAGEAVRHTLTAKNFAETCQILHEYYNKILLEEGPILLSRCLSDIPMEILNKFPRLVAHMALFKLIQKGKEEALPYLSSAEDLYYEKKTDQKDYLGILSAVKAYFHIFTYNFSEAKKEAQKAMDLLPENNLYWRMNVGIYLGDAALFSGDPKSAYPYYLDAHRSIQKSGNKLLVMTSNFKVATSLYYRGKLDEAENLLRSTLKDARLKGLSNIPRIGLLWTLLGEVLREKGALDEAERCIERGLLYSEPEKPCLGWNYIFKIALSFSQQKYDQALESVYDAEFLNHEVQLPIFVTSAIERWKARIFAEKGDIVEAINILDSSGVNKESTAKGGYEWRHLVLARILLMQENPDLEAAGRIIEDVEKLATQGEYIKLLLEALIVKTLYAELTGDVKKVDELMLSTLSKGKKHGFYQIFCDSRKGIEPILRRLLKRNTVLKSQDYDDLQGFIETLLSDSLIDPGTSKDFMEAPPDNPVVTKETSYDLVEDLTARELEVLSLINEGLSNEAIANQLFLSLGTIKWHTTNIYGKLGVRRRTEAVAQARKLNIIS